MTNKQLRLAKIFIAINLVLITLLSAFAFYGKHITMYNSITMDGVHSQKNFFELLKVMYFSDNDDYTKASINILNEYEHVYKNYSFNTAVSIGKGKANDTVTSEIKMEIRSNVDDNKSIGFISFLDDDKQMNSEYKYYRVCDDGVVSTYLLVGDIWYVMKEDGENVAFNINQFVQDLKNGGFKQYPKREVGEIRATLYPDNECVDIINICECRAIGSIKMINSDAETFAVIANKSIGETCDEQIKTISEWMVDNKYKYHVIHSIQDIGKVSVDIPENIDQIAVEGNVYDIIMTKFANGINKTNNE